MVLFVSENDEIELKIYWNTNILMGWHILFYSVFMESSFSPIFALYHVVYVIDWFAGKF